MFTDAHAHLYDLDAKEVIDRAKENLVDCIICASSDEKTMNAAVRIANEREGVFATVGVHPQDAENYSRALETRLAELAANKKVVAIGEIGLDYHYAGPSHEIQKRVFKAQLALAERLGKPIQIHIRDAMEDALEILEEHRTLLKNGGVVHCFGGTKQEAEKILALGLDFTIGGVCTFKNARALQEVVKWLPLEHIMLETDCPYLAPEPLRGTVNEPKNVVFVAEKIAALKGISAEEVARITTENVKRVFRI